MNKYRVIVCTQDRQQSFNVVLYADNDYACKQLAEAQYGRGNVLSYHMVTE